MSTLGISKVSISSIPDILAAVALMSPKPTPCFVGDAGVGKTPITEAFARTTGRACHVMNFGHMSPQEAAMALFEPDGSSYAYKPSKRLLKVNIDAENKENYPNGVILFLDEVNRAHIDVLNVFFTLPDERRLHDFVLHPDVMIVAAMNPSAQGHNVNRFEKDPAMRKRLMFIEVAEDLNAWLSFAHDAGRADSVLDFLRTQGEAAFYNRALRDAGKVYPTPNAWDKVCRVVESGVDVKSTVGNALISGLVGVETAREFIAFSAARAFAPTEIFGGVAGAAFARMESLMKRRPNASELTALRVATAPWLANALTVRENVTSVHKTRFKAWFELLGAERRQAFFTDLANVQTKHASFPDDLTWFFAECGLEDTLSAMVDTLSAG